MNFELIALTSIVISIPTAAVTFYMLVKNSRLHEEKNDYDAVRQDLTFHYNAFTSYQNALEARQSSLEGRQTAIEDRVALLEDKHEILQDHTNDLTEDHADLVDSVEKVSKSVLEKTRPVYIQNGGGAVCSKCGHTVARFFHDGPSIVCANCDPESFAKAMRG